jgi:hypothetical protein
MSTRREKPLPKLASQERDGCAGPLIQGRKEGRRIHDFREDGARTSSQTAVRRVGSADWWWDWMMR